MNFSKTILTFCFGFMALCSVEAQSLNELHSKSVTVDNKTNLLRHGDHEYEYYVNNGKIETVIYRGVYMTEIVGDQKVILINQLLGDKADEYSVASEANISIWKTNDFYTIFDLNTRINDTNFKLKFYLKKQ